MLGNHSDIATTGLWYHNQLKWWSRNLLRSQHILKALAIVHTTGHLFSLCHITVTLELGSEFAKHHWQGKVQADSGTLLRMLSTTSDCYLVPLAIVDSGGDHGASVTTSQVVTEVGESIFQLHSSKISMIDSSHVKEQAWFSFGSHF